MLVRQSKNSFIRSTDRYGYVTNQLTHFDRVYNSTGADFLREITREAKDVENIVDHLLTIYEGVERPELKKDFIEFLQDLADHHFVVIGDDEDELNKNDILFSYDGNNPKSDFGYLQESNQEVSTSTQDFFLEEVQGTPKISALQFELTSRCNERCIHCYIPNEKKNHGFDMPTEKVKSIIDEFSAMGGIHVTISGGEAFMHKDLIEIVNYCREKDLKISILSNLISLKDEQIPLLKAANVSVVQVSLYSVDPVVHDTITTIPGSCKKTMEAIEKLVKANIPVQISCPLMKVNKDSLVGIHEYARKFNIRVQTDYLLMARADLSTDNLDQRLSLEEVESVLRATIENDYSYRNGTLKKIPRSEAMLVDFEKFKNQPVCGVGYDNCCITANGDVYPCAGWQGYILGNVYKQSLSEIWTQSERIKALRKVQEKSFPKCLECKAYDYCARCLVRNFNESNGDMFAISQAFCDEAFLLKRLVEEYHKKGIIESPFLSYN